MERLQEILSAFDRKEEIWLTNADLQLLAGLNYPTHLLRELKPGERISSETGKVNYSSRWLGDV